jgi:hypothetical protein
MAIISLNRGRLLSRLRSQHTQKSIRNRNKLAISARLEEAVHLSMDYTAVLASSGIDVIAIEAEAGRFQTTFRELEEKGSEIGTSHLLLANLINCAHTLATKLQLGNLLDVLPNKQLGPSGRESLLIGIQKIGRYKSACEFLFLAAQKLEIFQKMEIEAISLPVSATEPLKIPDYVPSLTATLARIDDSGTHDINRLCASLERKVGVSPASAQHEFEQRVPRVLGSSKIHAEIQILYHYEMHPVKIRPRVICSSKSACFLCDLFIKFHGKFYIARTHGRLYEQWRLPVIRGLPLSSTQLQHQMATIRSFDIAIEHRISGMLLSKRRLSHSHPNESMFIQSPSWTSSNLSIPKDGELLPKSGPAQHQSDSDNVAEEIGNPSSGEGPIRKEPTISSVTSDSRGLSKQKSEWFRPPSEELIQGVEIRRELSTDHELCFLANDLCIFVGTFGTHPGIRAEISTDPNSRIDNAPDRCWVNIEWLSDNEAVRIGDIMGLSAVNVGVMESGSELTTSNGSPMTTSNLYITLNADIVCLKYNLAEDAQLL